MTPHEQAMAAVSLLDDLGKADSFELGLVDHRRKYDYRLEAPGDGESVLYKSIQEVLKDDGRLRLLVIPTLDGVRGNLAFLNTLADQECRGAAICVHDRGTTWNLADPQQFDRFDAWVQKVFDRRYAREESSRLIKDGLQRTKAAGTPLGGQRPNAYKFSEEQRRKGQMASLEKRKWKARNRYKKWEAEVKRKRAAKDKLNDIAVWLSQEMGRRIDRTTVLRILKGATN